MTDKKKISVSHGMKKGILYEDGTVLHFYDKSTYPGGQNFEETLNGRELSEVVKKRLLDSASEENKLLVKELLNIQEE